MAKRPGATRTSRVEGPADRQIPAMSRWDGLKSNADQSHASNQHRGHRPRPGSGGGGGRRQTQQQQQATASWRRGAGPSGGGGDAEAKQAFDRDLRLLEQKLKKVQGAEHSEVGDAAAAVEEALLALQVQQRQKWLRFDPKRVGWSVESLFRAVQCMAPHASVGAEPLVYDMTADALEMLRGSNGGDSWRMSTARTSECVAALVLRFRSLALVDTTVVAETTVANVLPTAKSILQCLNAIFAKLGSILPAEETAERLVRPLFVPVLESASSSSITGDVEQSCRQALCRSLLPATVGCISSLISQKRQASAILAPLVLDILEDGDEREVANPLRLQLLSLLQGSLLNENDESVLASTCECFSDILDAVYFIDRGNKARGRGSGKEATDINVASTARRIRTLLERSGNIEGRRDATDSTRTSISNLRVDILRLLSSLARAYPKAMAGQWAFFLEETMLAYDPLSSPLKSASSGLTASSPLLVTFIQSGDSKGKVAAMEAGRALICALPLKLWFGLGSRRDGRRTFTGTTSLASRVAKALGQLLAALKSAVLVSTEQISSDEIVIEACTIVEVVIQTEPFLYDATLALALTDLLDTLRMLIIKQLSKSPSRDTVAVVIIRAFVKGTGGTINPKGDLIPLSKPVEEWLSRAENRKFLFRLFSMLVKPLDDMLPSSGCGDGNNEDDNFLFTSNVSIREEAGTLLMLVLRMAPSILGFGDDDSGWTPHVFSSAVQSLLGDIDPKRRQLGLQFVRHYVQGRNDFLSEEISPFVCEAFGSVLLRALGDTNAGIRSSSAATYGLFLHSDWAILLEKSSDHFHHLLQMCVGKDTSRTNKIYAGESSAGVRSEACKAIGNMCSECCRGSSGNSTFSGSGSDLDDREETPLHIDGLDQIVCNVLDTVTIAVDDKNAGVRGMALFCIGNLSLSLQTAAGVMSEGVASNSSLPILCTSVHKCLEDKNDKVVGNAIRTSGHLLSLLRSSGDEGSIHMSDALYRCTVVTLTQKLNLALDIAEGKATNMSWKQRSIAKKHSWGSCHTLGVLLPCASSEKEPNRKLFLAAISQMIRCIQLARTLSEKVTAAAAAALKQTPMDMWREFSGVTTTIADGLVACLIVVYEEAKGVRAKRLSPPIRNDVQDLLNLFLAISSADDAISSFSNDAISPGILDFLYSWMVDKGSKSSSFDSIATALTSNVRVGEFEVSIEQRFSSRARHERRREGASPNTKADRRGEEESFVAINLDSRDGNDDSDEEDEL